MVVQSDKGKECVVCYRTTYLTLVEAHFSNTNLYKPVDMVDIAGRNLETMTRDKMKTDPGSSTVNNF